MAEIVLNQVGSVTGGDTRPRWQRLATQYVAAGWRLVIDARRGRAWWSREGRMEMLDLDRARAIAALGLTPPSPVIDADEAPPAPPTPPAPPPVRRPSTPEKIAARAAAAKAVYRARAERAAALYTGEDEPTTTEIGVILECSASHVAHLLRHVGVPLRRSGPRPRPSDLTP